MADDLGTIRRLVAESATAQQLGCDLFGRLEAAIRQSERADVAARIQARAWERSVDLGTVARITDFILEGDRA